MTNEEAWGFQSLMVIAAFRYCLGRQSYIVSCCADWLIRMWDRFPEDVRAIIKRDLEQAFAEDNWDREGGCDFKRLGMDCDRREWERVRALWAGEKT